MVLDPGNRRDFLRGRLPDSGRARPLPTDGSAVPIGMPLADAPAGSSTLRWTTRAMACDFSVILNPGSSDDVMAASSALDAAHEWEDLLSVYREQTLISRVNREAAEAAVQLPADLFRLLDLAARISAETRGAFDLTTGPLIARWRTCRSARRIPTQRELDEDLTSVGMRHIIFDQAGQTVRFALPGASLNLGAIGKGFALDQIGMRLQQAGVRHWLLHGGRSSILACGDHQGTGGWPIGIGNPLFTDRRLGTILLVDQAMGTSGSNIQFFHHAGRRYGHILDPRTGWPVDGVLSVTAIAPTAALADALSTAFYVMGLDEIRRYCDSHPEVGAIVIPFPAADRRVAPLVIGFDIQRLFWDGDQVRGQLAS